MAYPTALGRTLLRFLLIAVFVVLPLTSLWNLSVDPRRGIHIGPKLGGVTEVRPAVALSWTTIADGSFQKELGTGIAEAFPLRPLLINLNNSIRFELFGDYPHSYIVRGAKSHLFGRIYLDEYCARTVGQGARLAAHPAKAAGHPELLPHIRRRVRLFDLAVQGGAFPRIFRR
jgi:hypothetical protein